MATHLHLFDLDPIAWHCVVPGCTAAATDPYAKDSYTYGWPVPHTPNNCYGLRVDRHGDCTLCGRPRGIPHLEER